MNNKAKGFNFILVVLFALLFVGSVFMVSARHYDLYVTYRKYWTIILGLLFIWSFCIGVVKNKDYIELPIDKILGVIVLTGLLESLYALAQFFKIIPSFNRFYAYTGSFDNPAIFAMLLSVCVPIAVYYANKALTIKKKKEAIVWWTVAALMLIFIGFSESRTALMATIISSFIVCLSMSDSLRDKLFKRRTLFILIPIVLVLLFLIYKFKADSANGRLLMWRVSMDMIKDKPLFGFGFNGFTAHYLEYQANYFINNPDSPFLLLADNVNNPFNEYILVLINYGLTGFVLLLGLIFLTLRKLWLLQKDYKIVLIALAVAIMVLGFFSYPFSLKFIWALIAFIIMVAFCGTIRSHRTLSTTVFTVICSIGMIIGFYRFMIEREWKLIYERTLVEEDMESVLPDYKRIYDQLNGNAKFLYNYGAELHYSGHYKECLQIMGECIKKDNDYDVQMIIGNSYQHLGDTIKALEHYAFANNMVPSKFKPLSLSMKLYVEKRDTVNALNIANAILAKDVKINRSKSVQRIITEAEEVINTLTECE